MNSEIFRPALTVRDVSILVSCMNEALEVVEDWEFSTRVGADKAQVMTLMDRLKVMVQGNA